mmetsp:Transcript_40830/g.94726  ORF Transcript_40830/g.94726 Transcript_40830/m.94726 type:complete len:92 (-) Transcript_40830:977-1252(-)
MWHPLEPFLHKSRLLTQMRLLKQREKRPTVQPVAQGQKRRIICGQSSWLPTPISNLRASCSDGTRTRARGAVAKMGVRHKAPGKRYDQSLH